MRARPPPTVTPQQSLPPRIAKHSPTAHQIQNLGLIVRSNMGKHPCYNGFVLNYFSLE